MTFCRTLSTGREEMVSKAMHVHAELRVDSGTFHFLFKQDWPHLLPDSECPDLGIYHHPPECLSPSWSAVFSEGPFLHCSRPPFPEQY